MTEGTGLKQRRLSIALNDEENKELLSLCGKYQTPNRTEIIRQLIKREYTAMTQQNQWNQVQQTINPTQNTKEG